MKSLLRVIVSVAGLTAAPALALECEEGFRAFAHAAGETCVPENPQRIVTLQDQNALLPLLELGVRPVGSAGHINADGQQIFRRVDGFDTAGIVWIGRYGEPDPEAVAALKPDLIIAAPWPADAFEIHSKIAPTIVVDMFNQPLEDALFQFADVVNKIDRAKELQQNLVTKAENIRGQLGARSDKTTVSLIEREYNGSGFHGASPTQSVGAIRRALGLTMSPPEKGWASRRENKSLEAVGTHTADVMFFISYDADEGGHSNAFNDFKGEAAVGALPVSQAGQLFVLDGSSMVGSAWSKIARGMDLISAVLLRDDLNRELVQE